FAGAAAVLVGVDVVAVGRFGVGHGVEEVGAGQGVELGHGGGAHGWSSSASLAASSWWKKTVGPRRSITPPRASNSARSAAIWALACRAGQKRASVVPGAAVKFVVGSGRRRPRRGWMAMPVIVSRRGLVS